MLKKLLKYDLKSSVKIFSLSSVIMIAVMFMGGVAMAVSERLDNIDEPNAVQSAVIALCGLVTFFAFALLFAYSIVIVVLVVRRFYCSFFTDEGYLTFTLPASIHSQLLSKTLFGVIYSFGGLIVQGISLFLCGLSLYIFSDFTVDFPIDAIGRFLDENSGKATVIMLLFALFVICSEIFSVMVLYLAFTIGSAITGKYKLVAGIAVYFGINMLFQFIPMPLSIMFFAAMPEDAEISVFGVLSTILIVGIVISLAVSVICYFVTHSLLKNKLNLA